MKFRPYREKIIKLFCKHKFKSYIGHSDMSKSQERKYHDDYELLICKKCGQQKTRDL